MTAPDVSSGPEAKRTGRVPAERERTGARSGGAKPLALILDLSGEKPSAGEWAARFLEDRELLEINKADLKWRSNRDSLSYIRSLAPETFAVFSSDLRTQSARGAMALFGALTGARRIVLGDSTGRTLERSRTGVLFREGPRLALEYLLGYCLVIPLSLLLTSLLGAMLGLRKIVRGSAGLAPRSESLAVLYLRATLLAPTAKGAAPGGMASHVSGFARGALALGHRLKFLAFGDPGVRGKGVDVETVELSSRLSATRALFELWNNLVFSASALRHLASEQRGGARIDFIYQRYSRFNWTGVLLSLTSGLPLFLEFNGSEVWAGRHWDPIGQLWLLARFERLNLRAADRVFVVSDVERRNLLGSGVESERIVVNPNGVDAGEFHPGCGGRELRRALGIDDKVVVGFLGTFGPWHGAPALAEAAALVSRSSNCHFLFIGDGDQKAMTEALMEKASGVAGWTFTGRIPHGEVRAYLDACDILSSPHVAATDGSEFFGSPTKLFEYMAMARPVVASRLGQIADVIEDGESGLLVEPGSSGELARAIDRLASDGALRQRLGVAARRRVEERYTWRHNASRVFDRAKKS
ncbi:MAG TPA: glycosyltransferase family 4 protein [Blastocatellia bacterium]|nr:glycosyltransferase family 4 protein [Blastocatellia bacterium]